MFLQRLVLAVTMIVASGCPDGELDWECHADKRCPDGELCVAPQNLPEDSTDSATDPACYTVCSSSAQCPGGNRACLGELCLLFDDDCAANECPEGFFCNTLSHCEKLPCSSATGVCAPSCIDFLLDGDESDVDCGGSCTPCADNRRCSSGSDCQSGVCDAAGDSCAVPACDDGVANGTEIGRDCGGECAARCPAGEPCHDDGDCESGVCSTHDNVCQAATCDDGIANQGETAIDCGGPCAGCPDGFPCNGPDDCDSQVCAGHTCASGTCADGAENGDETDVDCGGSCGKCAAGRKCRVAADCDSGVCDADDVCRLLLSFGSTSNDQPGSVAVTAGTAGDVILVTGFTADGLDLGGGVVSPGSFLARLEPSGGYVWSEPLPVASDWGALAVDASGNIVVVGSASGDIYVGSFSLEDSGDSQKQWEKTFDSVDGAGVANDVAVDNTGNVLVAGYFRGKVDFGDPCPRLTSDGRSALVAKFSTNGACVWAKGFGNGEALSQGVTSVAADDESVVATGLFRGSIDLGDGERTSAGSNDVFVVKLFSDGSHDWSKTFGGSKSDLGRAVADTNDGVVFTGTFASNTIDFGGAEPHENAGGDAGTCDLFVAKLALDGSHVWSRSFGGTGTDIVGRGVGVDADDNITLTGRFGGTISFGGPTLDSQGSYDIFVVRLASGGEPVRSYRFGGPDPDWGNAVALDSSGRAVVIGGFAGAADFGGSTLNSAGGADICVFTVAP